MDEYVYTYIVDLPPHISEMVAPCCDGYTIYLAASLSPSGRARAYNHAMRHIRNHDFEKYDVQQIETEAHKERRKDNGTIQISRQ